MFDFFQALSEFLKSDLAKGYGWTIIALVVVCMIFSGFVVWFYMEKGGKRNAEKGDSAL